VYTPNPVQAYVSTDDPDGIVAPNQAINYITTVNADTDVDPGVLEYTLPSALGAVHARDIAFAGRTETVQKPLTVVAGATSGQIRSRARYGRAYRAPVGHAGSGMLLQPPQSTTWPPTLHRCTASRPDRQGNYLFNSLLSNSTNRQGAGDVRIDEVPAARTARWKVMDFRNGAPTYLRGNTSPSIACNDGGVCMSVWISSITATTVTIGQQQTVRTGDEPTGCWSSCCTLFDNTDRTPSDGGYEFRLVQRSEFRVGPNNINQTRTFCGNGRSHSTSPTLLLMCEPRHLPSGLRQCNSPVNMCSAGATISPPGIRFSPKTATKFILVSPFPPNTLTR